MLHERMAREIDFSVRKAWEIAERARAAEGDDRAMDRVAHEAFDCDDRLVEHVDTLIQEMRVGDANTREYARVLIAACLGARGMLLPLFKHLRTPRVRGRRKDAEKEEGISVTEKFENFLAFSLKKFIEISIKGPKREWREEEARQDFQRQIRESLCFSFMRKPREVADTIERLQLFQCYLFQSNLKWGNIVEKILEKSLGGHIPQPEEYFSRLRGEKEKEPIDIIGALTMAKGGTAGESAEGVEGEEEIVGSSR